MIPEPYPDDWRKRWVQARGRKAYALHRVLRMENDDWEADGLIPIGGKGEVVCGARSSRWHMPGIFSRMGAPRCSKCCKKLGIPTGDGAPFNANGEERDWRDA